MTMNNEQYLPLSSEAISILKKNGCWSRHWEKVMVSKGFDPTRVAGTIFRGEVRIGSLEGHFIPRDEIRRYAGIFDANLHNVVIGDNCHISKNSCWDNRRYGIILSGSSNNIISSYEFNSNNI